MRDSAHHLGGWCCPCRLLCCARRARASIFSCCSRWCRSWGWPLLSGCRGSREAQLEEIRALQDAGLYAETIEPLRELLAESPDQPEANYRLGTALLRTGQASLALWPLHKAAASEEYGVSAGLALATTLLGQGQREEALEAANGVLEIEPGHEGALSIRAQAALAGGDPEQALADAERLVEISPDRYLVLRAAALAELGRLDEAEQVYAELASTAEQLDPQTASQACFALAKFYAEKREDAERAGEQIESCLEPNPANPAAVRLAVQLYDGLELPEQATATLRRAVEAEPSELRLRQSLADRLLAEGKAEEAEAQLARGGRGARDARGLVCPGQPAARTPTSPSSRWRRSSARSSSHRGIPRSCVSSSPTCWRRWGSWRKRSASPRS